MLKAKLDSIRKNKKGFSLIELIIVIAIMVALIAVMAPNFVKYVQKSRDTALQTAAEDFYSAVKVAYGDPDTDLELPEVDETYTITVEVADKHLSIDGDCDDLDALKTAAGVDEEKAMGTTTDSYTITIKGTTNGPEFKMSKDS